MDIGIAALLGALLGALFAWLYLRGQLAAAHAQGEAARAEAKAELGAKVAERVAEIEAETVERARTKAERALRAELDEVVRKELRSELEPAALAEAKREAEAEAGREAEQARREAERIVRDAELRAKQIALEAARAGEEELRERRQALDKIEARLEKREASLDLRATKLDERERAAAEAEAELRRAKQEHEEGAAELEAKRAGARAELERVAGLSAEEARREIVSEAEAEAKLEATKRVRAIEEEAIAEGDRRAQKVISIAVQRYAGEFAVERCVNVVALPSDELKGRIIGREGRNIRALEAATGIDVIIDDTPEAVIISGFDPVRREIAKLSLEKLISDGRIHPSRIEEVVAKTKSEVGHTIREAGERAAFELGLHGLHAELLKLLGRLRYRTSYGQNMWSHSIEVGYLCGLMAAELGLSTKVARRAGLLHDIGKALTHEQEGSHALIGAELAKKHGESEIVRNAIAAHHNEEPQNSVIAHLVIAADALSGARPGARREILETYIKRLEELEKISMSFDGVEKSYAIQAGREIRVMVENAKVDDDQAFALSKEIARKIEDELTYPGQIRVTVIRETRATEYAR